MFTILKGLAKRSKTKTAARNKPADYTLFNQKTSFDLLKSHLWAAADILRGSLYPADYRQPIMTLLFIKRLNDTFKENVEKLVTTIRKVKNIKESIVWDLPFKNMELRKDIIFYPALY